MSLSLVIPVYRQRRCLDLTLGSLAAQTPDPGDFEVIVVDDDSGDDTASVVAGYRGRLPVRLLHQNVNRGRAVARNAGAAAAAGERIVFLDADSFADPGLLHAHAAFHRSFPGKVLLGPRVEGTWGPAGGERAAQAGEQQRFSLDVRYKLGLDPGTFDTQPVPWIFAYTHNMSLPAADFRACGGFDECFSGWGYEDVEFAYRLHAAAGRETGYFRFDPAALCYHLPHFRQARSNWAQAERMLPYINAKHRTLELEFIDEGPMGVCDMLPAYLGRLRLLHSIDAVGGQQKILAALPAAQDPGRLVVGIGLTGHIWNEDLTERIDHRPPGGRTAPGLVGMRLPYPDNRFADLVNFDLWRVLSPDHLSQLIVEGLRVARIVYLGYSEDVASAARAGLAADPGCVCDLLSTYCEPSIIGGAAGVLVIRAKRR
jgi:glycosyltransferase involved in cell wall biosynthesis